MRPALILALLAAGCASHPVVGASPPVVCPVPPPVVIVRHVAAPVAKPRVELRHATASALLLIARPGISADVVAHVTQLTRDATAAVDKLARRERYRLANAADRKRAREAVGALDDYIHEQGAQ